MSQDVLLTKLKEAGGNHLVIGCDTEEDMNAKYLAASKLQDDGIIEIIDIAKNDDSTFSIKARVL
ncbi:hypothetical protein ABER98_11550 [Domibacillus aminovorans]|uniref:Uncharacterized protein n=1 Tax=Domibacillus aminovorans TaxID=29332 RepID=A0A177L0R1_9BACI|nr:MULTISPECIES: hypothetical protein [Bacillaceae]OAH59213.1 hypothetical protein AWH48_15830 [Domibacillus aminovorans]